MFEFIKKLFSGRLKSSAISDEQKEEVMKYLVVGLGNIGPDYEGTRHNIGFMVADALISSCHSRFEDKRYGFVGKCRVKNAELVVVKPSTFMNLSGNAVRYWLQKEKINPENMIVVCDDISLPLGKIRIRPQGSDGGHNGLKHIASVLGNQKFARMRIGVGNDFPKGTQINYVLGKFSDEELSVLSENILKGVEAVKTFCLSGVTMAMNQFNH